MIRGAGARGPVGAATAQGTHHDSANYITKHTTTNN